MPTDYFDTYFPDYEVISKFDQGDEWVIKTKRQPPDDLVLIKQYDCTLDANARLNLEHELKVITQTDHPNVVRVREVKFGVDIYNRITNFWKETICEAGFERGGLLINRMHTMTGPPVRLFNYIEGYTFGVYIAPSPRSSLGYRSTLKNSITKPILLITLNHKCPAKPTHLIVHIKIQ